MTARPTTRIARTALARAVQRHRFQRLPLDCRARCRLPRPPAGQDRREIPGFLLPAGGLPLAVESDVVGAIGVAGAPGGHLDAACAQAGIDTIADA